MRETIFALFRYRGEFGGIFAGIVMTIRGLCLIGNPKVQKLKVKIPLESKTSGLLTLLSAKM